MSRDVIQIRRWVATSALIVALVAGGFVGTWAVQWAGQKVLGEAKVPVKEAGAVSPVRLGEFANGFASVVQPALPAVVNISTTQVIKVRQNMPGFFNDPLFRQFFGDQFGPQSNRPMTQREQSLGSGVIVNPDGYIITNNHVVANATDVEVTTRDKKQYKATIVGKDPATDIAVLKINASNLPTLTLGDSSKLEVGDVVFAIGDPFGIGETATMGIVSATGRSMGGQIERYEDFIQTDAAINPGNSGGAMIDLHGNLVGINTAIIPGQAMNGEGGNIGIGFAIPISSAKNVMEQIIEHGKVERGYLGVLPQPVTAEMAKQFGREEGGGALVAQVSPGTPAAKAGLQRGDIILQVNGQDVSDNQDLSSRIAAFAPGTSVQLKVFRNGQTLEVPVTLGQLPASELGGSSAPPSGPSEESSKALEGVEVENLTPDILGQLDLPASTRGVVVDSVDGSSAAAEARLQRGDVIQEVNHKPVDNLSEYRAALAGTGDKQVLLLVERMSPNGVVTNYILIQP
ncbi:MAG TPA: DegQ family serine endoprotease [Candidatus Acidoferrales bacterium]|nr:DegQ family serine endoprotease [Candidatus Acidoferrales bacterium]